MVRRCSKGPDRVDVHVGSRLRQRRILLGLSQQALGDHLGLSFQQVQKYEKGSNRVSASRLFELTRLLGVPVGFFFEDLPAFRGTVPVTDTRHVELPGCSCVNCRSGTEPGPDLSREALKLVGAYYRIRPLGLRKKLLALIQSLGTRAARKPAQSRDLGYESARKDTNK